MQAVPWLFIFICCPFYLAFPLYSLFHWMIQIHPLRAIWFVTSSVKCYPFIDAFINHAYFMILIISSCSWNSGKGEPQAAVIWLNVTLTQCSFETLQVVSLHCLCASSQHDVLRVTELSTRQWRCHEYSRRQGKRHLPFRLWPWESHSITWAMFFHPKVDHPVCSDLRAEDLGFTPWFSSLKVLEEHVS